MTEFKTNLKDIRKIAFAIGLGATLGKFAGDCFIAVLNGSLMGAVKGFASNGVKTCQEVCDQFDWDYDGKEKMEETSDSIGFKVNGRK